MSNHTVRAGVRGRRLAVALAVAASALACNKTEEAPAGTSPAPAPSAAAPLVTDGTGPKIVPGPGTLPECFAPWNKDTKFLQWPAKKPPYRIALVNGYVGNAWRIQMVKTAKAFAKDPAFAPPAAAVLTARRFLWAEVFFFALIPVFAAAMARGYGAAT